MQAVKRSRSSGVSNVEERKAKAKEFEAKLLERHKDKWTTFQYKLWSIDQPQVLLCSPVILSDQVRARVQSMTRSLAAR